MHADRRAENSGLDTESTEAEEGTEIGTGEMEPLMHTNRH
jgi:hypothetical protein